MPKGKTMGQFRSAGQLGRALGPIFGTLPAPSYRPLPAKSPSDCFLRFLCLACTSYWLLGPTVCYALNGLALGVIGWQMTGLVKRERELRAKQVEQGQGKKDL